MKKIFAFVCALTLLFCSATMVSAAALTQDEQNIMKVLNSKVEIEGIEVGFPREIIIQSENFLLAEDITSSQAKEVIGYLEDIINLVESNPKYISTSDVYNSTHPRVKDEIDKFLNKIYRVLNLSRSYDGENVNIVNREGVVYFSDEPVIKATGTAPDFIIPIIIGCVCGSLCFIALRRKVRG